MPNVTWQEPQALVDLLAINLLAHRNKMSIPGPRQIAVVSPWLSDVELSLRPGAWHQHLAIGSVEGNLTLVDVLRAFCDEGWRVEIAVLSYGLGPPLPKNPAKFSSERQSLARMIKVGTAVYFVPGLHAKGIVTPLGIITGSTNLTTSGLFAQSQNANYFAHDHPDYAANRVQLLARFAGLPAVTSTP
jgi:hypothetical protein